MPRQQLRIEQDATRGLHETAVDAAAGWANRVHRAVREQLRIEEHETRSLHDVRTTVASARTDG